MSFSKNNRKKIMMGVLGMVLVSIIVVSITVAYLQSKTEEVVNVFTLGEGVDLELLHEGGTTEGVVPGSVFNKSAKVFVPETVTVQSEYLAIKVEFYIEKQNEQGNLILEKIDSSLFKEKYANLVSYNVDGLENNTDGKEKINGMRIGWETTDDKIFYYGKTINGEFQFLSVKPGSTVSIWDQIKVNDPYESRYKVTITNPILTYDLEKNLTKAVPNIQEGQLETFHTVISAYAVQGDISTEQAMEEFAFLLNNSN